MKGVLGVVGVTGRSAGLRPPFEEDRLMGLSTRMHASEPKFRLRAAVLLRAGCPYIDEPICGRHINYESARGRISIA
eukprot:6177140-Pleurochrysis_carterae.AAC.4